jgi:uncharacterized OsmC-like protein
MRCHGRHLDTAQDARGHHGVRGRGARRHGRRASAAVTHITLTHRLTGRGLVEGNVRRAIFLSMSRYCPVFAMLAPSVPITVRYVIADADGAAATAGEVALEGEPESA